MVIRFVSDKKTPEKVLERAKQLVEEYCSVIEDNDGIRTSV